MNAQDYVGIAGLITSSGAVITGIIVVVRQTSTHSQVAEVDRKLSTQNGATVGAIIEANDMTDVGQHPEPHVR